MRRTMDPFLLLLVRKCESNESRTLPASSPCQKMEKMRIEISWNTLFERETRFHSWQIHRNPHESLASTGHCFVEIQLENLRFRSNKPGYQSRTQSPALLLRLHPLVLTKILYHSPFVRWNETKRNLTSENYRLKN